MKQFTFLGTNDDATVCENCGRENLKRVMWLAELDDDGNQASDAFPVGTTCGSKILKTDIKSFKKRVTKAKKQLASKKYRVRMHPASRKLSWVKRTNPNDLKLIKSLEMEIATFEKRLSVII